ncbi:MAG: pitrilysin family protein [Flavobacteriales bacterium]
MTLLKTRLATLFWLLVPAVFQAQGLEHLEQYTLSNGLTVILNEDHNRSEVFGYMVCKAGSKDDPADATGMAHYMEHLLFKGTETMGTIDWEKEKPHIDSIFVLYDKLGQTNDDKQRKEIQKLINEQSVKANEYAIPNELDNILKQMGGTQMNANTSPDRTVYLNTFPPNQMEKWLAVYSHRFQNPVFRSFQAELEVVYEEKNMGSDSFFNNIFDRFLKEAFKKHPYGQQSTIGTIDHLKNPSLTKMKEFFDRWYAPNNMALILSGDFDSQAVKPMIESAFKSWKQKEIPEHGHWEEEPFNGRELIEVRMSPVKIGVLAYRTVPENHPDYLALTLCNNLLSNESGSGLLNQLSTDHELLTAEAFPLPFYDHGLSIILFLPKIAGQIIRGCRETGARQDRL